MQVDKLTERVNTRWIKPLTPPSLLPPEVTACIPGRPVFGLSSLAQFQALLARTNHVESEDTPNRLIQILKQDGPFGLFLAIMLRANPDDDLIQLGPDNRMSFRVPGLSCLTEDWLAAHGHEAFSMSGRHYKKATLVVKEDQLPKITLINPVGIYPLQHLALCDIGFSGMQPYELAGDSYETSTGRSEAFEQWGIPEGGRSISFVPMMPFQTVAGRIDTNTVSLTHTMSFIMPNPSKELGIKVHIIPNSIVVRGRDYEFDPKDITALQNILQICQRPRE